ncbi:MAG: UDP-N-acetylmuramate dehydrogenase [Candidatus Margulisiibacteriota bacterium]
MKELYDKLSAIVKKGSFLNEPMSKHTTFKIGGPADLLIIPRNIEDLKKVLSEISIAKIPYLIMGNGSNLLVSDAGIRGVVIKICGAMDKIKIDGTTVKAQAGAYLGKLQSVCAKKGLSGFQFFSGIPSTVGGAIAMNAGSWGGTISLFLKNVTTLTKNAKVMELEKADCGFSYRSSNILKYGSIVLEAEFELEKRDPSLILAAQKEILKLKASSQPLDHPSAGCVFKNPPACRQAGGKETAGKIIEQAGLKGEKIGDAQISDVHANFIINTGNASADDVMGLINRIKKVVLEKTGISLELEIKTVGF